MVTMIAILIAIRLSLAHTGVIPTDSGARLVNRGQQ
jgi:hypothetical protein